MNHDGMGKTPPNRHTMKENVPVWNTQNQVTLDNVLSSGICTHMGFPGTSVVKNLPANVGDSGSIPGLGRCPGEENGNSLWYSCLENPLDRGTWQATVRGIPKSWTWLSNWVGMYMIHISMMKKSKKMVHTRFRTEFGLGGRERGDGLPWGEHRSSSFCIQASGILGRFYFIINLGSWRGGDDAGACFGIT